MPSVTSDLVTRPLDGLPASMIKMHVIEIEKISLIIL